MEFKATADAAVKSTIYSICSMPELSERTFCDGVGMKWDAANWCARNSCEKR